MNKLDKFTRRAFEEGYQARSVFKLKYIQSKFHIIKSGNKVLDLGAHPGSWSQFSNELGAKVTAVDVKPVKVENVKFVEENIFKFEPKEKYDVVLSDLSPNTSGIKHIDNELSYDLCNKALEIARICLIKKGNFLVKIFQGKEFDDFRSEMKKTFRIVRTVKPEGSKKTSKEIYLLGLNKI